jgi:hypothetical protein
VVVVVISRTTGLLLSPLMTSWPLEVQGLPRCCHGDNYLSRGGVTRPEHMLIHRRIWFVVVFSLLTPGQELDITSLSYCVCLCVLASMSLYCMCQSFIHSLHASLYNDLFLHGYVSVVLIFLLVHLSIDDWVWHMETM